jgi:hypothetical protein
MIYRVLPSSLVGGLLFSKFSILQMGLMILIDIPILHGAQKKNRAGGVRADGTINMRWIASDGESNVGGTW